MSPEHPKGKHYPLYEKYDYVKINRAEWAAKYLDSIFTGDSFLENPVPTQLPLMEEIREKIGEYLKVRGWKPVMDMSPVSEFAFGAVDPLTGKDHDELHALQIEWSRDFLQNQTK